MRFFWRQRVDRIDCYIFCVAPYGVQTKQVGKGERPEATARTAEKLAARTDGENVLLGDHGGRRIEVWGHYSGMLRGSQPGSTVRKWHHHSQSVRLIQLR